MSLADEIKKLEELFRSGVISQEVYDLSKKALLGGTGPTPKPSRSDHATPANIQLPGMVRAIRAYCLFINPILFVVLSILTSSNSSGLLFKKESLLHGVEVGFARVGAIGSLAIILVLVSGGYLLEERHRNSRVTILVGLWLSLGFLATMFLGGIIMCFMAVPGNQFAPDDSSSNLITALAFCGAIGKIIFEIVALVWLLKNKLPDGPPRQSSWWLRSSIGIVLLPCAKVTISYFTKLV